MHDLGKIGVPDEILQKPGKLTSEEYLRMQEHATIGGDIIKKTFADVFDAISAKRCYRDAILIDQCFNIIEEGIGSGFDPEFVKIFLNARDKVIQLFMLLKDDNESLIDIKNME